MLRPHVELTFESDPASMKLSISLKTQTTQPPIGPPRRSHWRSAPGVPIVISDSDEDGDAVPLSAAAPSSHWRSVPRSEVIVISDSDEDVDDVYGLPAAVIAAQAQALSYWQSQPPPLDSRPS